MYINDDINKVRIGGRSAKIISVDEFKEKLFDFLVKYNPNVIFDKVAFMKSNDPLSGYTNCNSILGCFINAVEKDNTIQKDLSKINFFRENGTSENNGNSKFLGLHVTENGLPFIGSCSCGDEGCAMVYFIIYYDGKKMRGYIPYYTNTYNPITKSEFTAYYEDEDTDFLNSIGLDYDDVTELEPDEDKLLYDINQRIVIIT